MPGFEKQRPLIDQPRSTPDISASAGLPAVPGAVTRRPPASDKPHPWRPTPSTRTDFPRLKFAWNDVAFSGFHDTVENDVRTNHYHHWRQELCDNPPENALSLSPKQQEQVAETYTAIGVVASQLELPMPALPHPVDDHFVVPEIAPDAEQPDDVMVAGAYLPSSGTIQYVVGSNGLLVPFEISHELGHAWSAHTLDVEATYTGYFYDSSQTRVGLAMSADQDSFIHETLNDALAGHIERAKPKPDLDEPQGYIAQDILMTIFILNVAEFDMEKAHRIEADLIKANIQADHEAFNRIFGKIFDPQRLEIFKNLKSNVSVPELCQTVKIIAFENEIEELEKDLNDPKYRPFYWHPGTWGYQPSLSTDER